MLRQFPEEFSFFKELSTNISNEEGITIAECAALSLDVYNNDDRPSLPLDWKIIYSEESAIGFRGACYVKNTTNKLHVVFANRGTIINIQNLIADLDLMFNQAPEKFLLAAWDFMKAAVTTLRTIYDLEVLNKASYTLTGHSLGAVLSDLVNVGFFNAGTRLKSITFENPGSKGIIYSLGKKSGWPEERITKLCSMLLAYCDAYFGDVNLINSWNEQLATAWRLTDLNYDYYAYEKGPMLPISANYLLNPYYFSYTVDQHKIQKITSYLQANGEIVSTSQPAGAMSGYAAYLDGESRKNYWEEYFSILWRNYPGLQDEYNGDYEKFHEFWKAELKRVRENVLEENFEVKKQLRDEVGIFSQIGQNLDGHDLPLDEVEGLFNSEKI